MRAIVFVLLLSGCGSLDWLTNAIYPKSELARLRIVADPEANRHTATALDLVFIYDKALLSVLPKSGPEWFDKKAALVANQPASFVVVSLQVPPEMSLDAPLPPSGNQPMGVFLYANYIDKDGQFPVNLTAFKQAEIRLKKNGIEYSSAP